MKVTIFGAGAVGGQIAARLAQGGHDTSVIVRGEHLAAIKVHGITLAVDSVQTCSTVTATDDPAQLGSQDLVIVTVKAHSLARAATGLSQLVDDHTHVLYVMNGIPWWFMGGLGVDTAPSLRQRFDPDGKIAKLVSPERFAWGVIRSGSIILKPGVIRNTTPDSNELVIGVPFGRLEPFFPAMNALADAGYRTTASRDIRVDIWSKLLINAGPAVLSALTGFNNREVARDVELRRVAMRCMQEIIDIGVAIGIRVEADPAALTDPDRTAPHVSSLLQDLQANRPVEIEHTILAVRDIGRAKSVPSPHLITVAALIAARVGKRLEV